MRPHVSDRIRKKLREKHGVRVEDVVECFANRRDDGLLDTREEHATDPPTRWIIAETNFGKRLKVIFIARLDGSIVIKSAYPPEPEAEEIYVRHKPPQGDEGA